MALEVSYSKEQMEIFMLKQEIDFLKGNGIDTIDEDGSPSVPYILEPQETMLIQEFLEPDDCVLELGGRTGTMSCYINKRLSEPTRHVVVEPDKGVHNIIEENRSRNNCEFTLVDGVLASVPLRLIGSGNATTCIPCSLAHEPLLDYNLAYVQSLVDTPFTCLIADCEGCLQYLMDDNPEMFGELRCFIYEEDCKPKTDYEKLTRILKDAKMSCRRIIRSDPKHIVWTDRHTFLKSKKIAPTSTPKNKK
tara:strand:+ start:628 stop:1374 length:747 start_codon:yes stop_codon:yes gene_type:complete